jgi:RNA-splicing ligase RtcB
VLIPGDMGRFSFVLVGNEKAMQEPLVLPVMVLVAC